MLQRTVQIVCTVRWSIVERKDKIVQIVKYPPFSKRYHF